MGKIKSFKDLEIWKLGLEIAIAIYKISKEKLIYSDFGMRDQIRRSASAIPNNIAEGFEYDNDKDFIRYLRYAKGSLAELRTQLYILENAQMISMNEHKELQIKLILLGKRMGSLMKYLKS